MKNLLTACLLICSLLAVAADEEVIQIYSSDDYLLQSLGATANSRNGDILVIANEYETTSFESRIVFTLLKRRGKTNLVSLANRYLGTKKNAPAQPFAAYDATRNRYLLIWTERDTSTYQNFLARRIGPDGKAKGNTLKVFPTANVHRRNAIIIPYNTKKVKECYLVVFEKQVSNGTDNGIHYQFLNASGQAVGQSVQLTSIAKLYTGITANRPSDIILGSDGYYYVVYKQETQNDGKFTNQYGVIGFKPGGDIKKKTTYNSNSSKNSNYFQLQIAQASDNFLSVVYTHGTSTSNETYYTRFRSKTDRLVRNGQPLNVSSDYSECCGFYRDADGNLHVIWGESNVFRSRKARPNGTLQKSKVFLRAPTEISEITNASAMPAKAGQISYHTSIAKELKDLEEVLLITKVWIAPGTQAVFGMRHKF
jgi:hypothetical protein